MRARQNCWEIKKCGREPGGADTAKFGVCAASTDTSCDGVNGGKNGGRICWAVTGTFCDGEIQGTFAQKEVTCTSCEVYKRVREEEGTVNFLVLKPGQAYNRII